MSHSRKTLDNALTVGPQKGESKLNVENNISFFANGITKLIIVISVNGQTRHISVDRTRLSISGDKHSLESKQLSIFLFYILCDMGLPCSKLNNSNLIKDRNIIRASKHTYTLSLGSKNLLTAFILLSRRCP